MRKDEKYIEEGVFISNKSGRYEYNAFEDFMEEKGARRITGLNPGDKRWYSLLSLGEEQIWELQGVTIDYDTAYGTNGLIIRFYGNSNDVKKVKGQILPKLRLHYEDRIVHQIRHQSGSFRLLLPNAVSAL